MTDYPIRHIDSNPTQAGLASMLANVTFTDRETDNLQMQILQPWGLIDEKGKDRLYPAVVFVQGSGWTFPHVYFQIPQLSQLARQGYVVATVTHRSMEDGHRAPAYLLDVKTAIRFLRAQADTLHIDPERIGIWGTSSGANAALLAGLTIDDPKYRTDEWNKESDAVSYVVDCFGPADTVEMVDNFLKSLEKGKAAMEQLSAREQEIQTKALASLKKDMHNFVGSDEGKLDLDLVRELSPIHQIKKDEDYPPVLILHGDQDELVDYKQSVKLYKALVDNGNTAEMITVDGGQHEDGFWSQEVLDAIWDFIGRWS